MSLAFSGPAWRWTQAGGMEAIGLLSGGNWSRGLGISDDGSTIVGTADTPVGDRAFRWGAATGIQPLQQLDVSAAAQAEQASRNGSVTVGWERGSGGFAAIQWNAQGEATEINGLPGGTESRALGVNGDGTRIMGVTDFANGDLRSFVWSEDSGAVDVGTLPGRELFLHDISADGHMAVGTATGASPVVGALWIEGTGVLDLNEYAMALGLDLGDWILGTAEAIAENAITGMASRPRQGGGFDNQPYVLVIPAPASASLVLGIPVLAGRRRRQH